MTKCMDERWPVFSLLQGEPFTPEEMEELFNAALDANTKTIPYKNYVHLLTVEDDTIFKY